MRSRVILFGLFLVLIAPVTWAQKASANWDNLKQITRGQRVQVVGSNLKSSKGKFVRATDSEIVITVDNNEVSIAREKVFRVSEDHRRGRNALYGAIVGAGIGAGIGAAAAREVHSAGDKAAVVVMVSGVWAGIGAGVSALATRNPTVYRAELKTPPPPKPAGE